MFLIVIMDGSVIYADDSVRLMVGRSAVITTGSPIARVSLTSSDIADALVTSPNELLVNGKTPGTISMFVWDRAGAIRRYEIIVQRDLARLSEQMKDLFPTEHIEVQSNGRNIALSGTVTNKDVIDRAVSLAAGYVDKKDEVVSLLKLQEGAPTNQVLLKVRFAEVSRSALTELGASFFTSPNGYKDFVGRVTTQQFEAPGFSDRIGPPPPSQPDSEGKFTFSDFLNVFLFNTKYQVGTVIRALQTRGLFQSLAEPNLVAESGKEASFLAGGEFPVPIAQPSAGTTAVTVTYKEFGIRLTFTPVVNGSRVHLKVKPEVSTLDFGNAVTLGGFRIPALSTRRTETELELGDGQTFAIAGLLNNTMSKTLQKVPGIGDIPILGLLFRSQAAQKDRTELVVMITPHILPNNSPGVTANLPRTPESFLPPLEPAKTMPMPPPAFTPEYDAAPSPRRGADVPAPAPKPAAAPASRRGDDAAAAAATMQALTPQSAAPKLQTNAPSAATPAPAPAVSRPLTEEQQKVVENARKEEHERAEAAKAADGKLRAKQIKEERRRAAEEKKKQEKAAREQAKKDEKAAKAAAEAAKRQAEIDKAAHEAAARRAAEDAKRQAEIDKENEKAVKDAEAKLKAAQAAYEAELAKTKKQPQGQ